jgi:hypothetical protein
MIRRLLSGPLILTLAVAGCSSSTTTVTSGPKFSAAAKKRFTPVKSPAPGPGKGRSGPLRGR